MLKYKPRYWKPEDEVDKEIIDYIKDAGQEPEAYQFTDLYKDVYSPGDEYEEYPIYDREGEEQFLLEECVYDKIRWIVDYQCFYEKGDK
tara:strand:+ start:4257 stop:4523 length:267 start_codon:yes stop_codon:yes gene_type:complete